MLSIKVENDQNVALGQPLIILDDVDIRASLDAAKAARYSWAAEVTRRKAALAAVDQADMRRCRSLRPRSRRPSSTGNSPRFMRMSATIRATLASIAAQKREAEARLARFQSVAQAQRNLIGILDEKSQMLEGLVAREVRPKAHS